MSPDDQDGSPRDVGSDAISGDPCDMVVCPDPEDVCSGWACVPADQDGDGDGFVARNDCDDGEPTTHPGAVERCNGVDDDCDRATPDGGEIGRASCRERV